MQTDCYVPLMSINERFLCISNYRKQLLRSKAESKFAERWLCIPTVHSMRRDAKDETMRKGSRKESEEEGRQWMTSRRTGKTLIYEQVIDV